MVEGVHLFGIQRCVGVKEASSPFFAFIMRWLVGTALLEQSGFDMNL
jgi:hypothetical protein